MIVTPLNRNLLDIRISRFTLIFFFHLAIYHHCVVNLKPVVYIFSSYSMKKIFLLSSVFQSNFLSFNIAKVWMFIEFKSLSSQLIFINLMQLYYKGPVFHCNYCYYRLGYEGGGSIVLSWYSWQFNTAPESA